MNCGQHCTTKNEHGSNCVLKPHEGAHVFGSLPCESGNKLRYVDQETADLYPLCGFGGVMTATEVTEAMQAMASYELMRENA